MKYFFLLFFLFAVVFSGNVWADVEGAVQDGANAIIDESTQEDGLLNSDPTPDPHPELQSDCYNQTQELCFKEPLRKVNKGFGVLEELYVIWRKTSIKYRRAMALADGAAGMQPYANMAWKLEKGRSSSEMNVAKKNFEEKYKNKSQNILQQVNDNLVAIGECARQHCNEPNWYARVGSPIYITLRNKYTNPQ